MKKEASQLIPADNLSHFVIWRTLDEDLIKYQIQISFSENKTK